MASLSFLVAVMVSCCFAQTPSVVNPYNVKFQTLESSWKNASAIEKPIVLDRAYELREYVDDSGTLTEFFAGVADDSSQHPLVRSNAEWYLGRMRFHGGDFDGAARSIKQLGFVRNWNILGPFAANEGLWANSDGGKWRLLPNSGPALWSDLGQIHGLAGSDVAFLTTALYCDRAQEVAFRFGAGSAAALFVNGQQVFASKTQASAAFDQYSVSVPMHAGWNTVVVKLAHTGAGSWNFALRVTGTQGEPLNVTADAAHVSGALPSFQADAQNSALAVADFTVWAERVLKTNQSAAALEDLGLLENLHSRPEALLHLQAAAKLAGSTEYWLTVAHACQNETCTFAALDHARAIDPNDPKLQSALANYYFDRGQLEKARDLLERAVAAQPNDFVARQRLADLYSSAGAMSEAMREYRKLEAEFPAPLWVKRELGLRYAEAGMADRARELLVAAVKQDGDDEDSRAALKRIYERVQDTASLAQLDASGEKISPAKLQTVAKDSALGTVKPLVIRDEQPAPAVVFAKDKDPDTDYLASVTQVAASARKNPPADNSNVIVLSDITLDRMAENGLSTTRSQQLFYIANDRGARDYRTRTVQYSHDTQQLQIVAARVHKADGQVVDAEDAGENTVADTSISMYYDTRSRVLRFPTLAKGDVLELDYRISPASSVNPYGDYFGSMAVFQSGLPEKVRRYVLIAPGNRRLNISEEHMNTKRVVKKIGAETVYSWEMRNVPPLPSESHGPSLTDIAPYVNVSTFGSWQQLGHWYANLIAPQFALDADLQDALVKIIAGKSTEQEKIHAIHEFVLRNTHYVAQEFGIYSYKPYPVSQIYARRFGDCKDKASLMIALLRAAGIDSDIALVRTRKLGDVGANATSIAVFNHAIVYIPKYDLWLDGTAEYAGSRELPIDDQGAMALTVSIDGDAQLRRIPTTLPMENYTHRVVRAELQNDGNINFSGSVYTRGEDAPGLRREYEDSAQQLDSLRNNLAQVYSGVRLEDVRVDGATNLEQDINVKFRGSLDSFAGRKLVSLVPSWQPHSYVEKLASLQARTQDLLLPAPWTTDEELHFVLPEGASLDKVPSNTQFDTPFGSAVIRYEKRGRELVVITSVQFRKLRISPQEYGQFRDFCTRLEQAFHTEIKVQLGNSAG